MIAAITLLPNGDAGRAEAIGLINIANVSDLAPVSDYKVWDEYGNEAMVIGHRRSDGWLPLVARACEALSREM